MEQKGIRKGIDKKKIMESLDEDDWNRIKLMKEVENTFVKDTDAYNCAVRTDQLYSEWGKSYSAAEGYLFSIISTKVRIDKNKVDLLAGKTDREFQDTKVKVSLRDLEIENINLNRILYDEFSKLYLVLADLYRYVGVTRVDKVEFFNKEDYSKLIKIIKEELSKNGLELFKERNSLG